MSAYRHFIKINKKIKLVFSKKATKIDKIFPIDLTLTKGQLILIADCRTIDSPKKRTDEFVLFAFLLFTANKSNWSVHFLGDSTMHQSAFWFYLTFT